MFSGGCYSINPHRKHSSCWTKARCFSTSECTMKGTSWKTCDNMTQTNVPKQSFESFCQGRMGNLHFHPHLLRTLGSSAKAESWVRNPILVGWWWGSLPLHEWRSYWEEWGNPPVLLHLSTQKASEEGIHQWPGTARPGSGNCQWHSHSIYWRWYQHWQKNGTWNPTMPAVRR